MGAIAFCPQMIDDGVEGVLTMYHAVEECGEEGAIVFGEVGGFAEGAIEGNIGIGSVAIDLLESH